MTHRRPTFVVALHDGFYGAGTGAGFTNRAFLEVLVQTLPARARLTVLPVRLSPTSPEYDHAWHAGTVSLLCRVDAAVYPVDNGTDGRSRFGGLGHFRHLVEDTAAVLTDRVLPDSDPVLVLAVDVPFFGLAAALPAKAASCLVLIPRSTARLFAPDDYARRSWERHGLLTAVRRGGRVAAISQFMRAHLREIGVPTAAMLDLPNGLMPADRQPAAGGDELLPAAGRDGFMLAMGRAHPYKGFEDLLDALAILRSAGNSDGGVPHLVLAAVTEDNEPSPYQQHLTHRVSRDNLDATVLTRFDTRIRDLLIHPALRAVVVPSRAEPFGRIPIEAYAAGAAPVVSTTAGGLTEQIIPGLTGITTPAGNPTRLAAALRHGLGLTDAERASMRENAQRLLTDRFDYPRNVRAFLSQAAPWLSLRPFQ